MMNVPGYEELSRILEAAYDQSANGKGKERHADGEPWDEQPIIAIGRRHRGFCLGQAEKKMLESGRLPKEMRIRELLGAIVYIAAEIKIVESEPEILNSADLKRMAEEIRGVEPSAVIVISAENAGDWLAKETV